MAKIAAIIGWVGTALVVVALGLRFLKPELDVYRTYTAWAGLACILVYLIAQWRESSTGASARTTKMGTMSVVSILAMLAILVAVNYLGVRQNKRWDLTGNQIFSLSEQTLKVLRGLDAPAKLTVYDLATNVDRLKARLEEYAYQSKQLTIEYVDIDREPARVRAANVTVPGTMVLEYKGRSERITMAEEQDIANAFIKATTGQEKKVYFVQGHGEKDPASADRTGYSAVAEALKGDNYGFEKLVLAQTSAVPDGATAVVVAGPVTDFFPGEIDALKKYLAKGGTLFAMIDPVEKTGEGTLPNFTAFLKEWGVEVGNDIVVDASGVGQMFGAGPTVPVAASYPAHPITDRFNLMTAYPLARSLTVAAVDGRTPQSIIETSDRSWAEKDLDGLAAGTDVSLDTTNESVVVTAPAWTVRANSTGGELTIDRPRQAVHLDTRRVLVVLILDRAVPITAISTDAPVELRLIGSVPITLDVAAIEGLISADAFGLTPERTRDEQRLEHQFGEAARVSIRNTRGPIVLASGK